MRFNVEHPSFLDFMRNMSTSINQVISTKDYYNLKEEKKPGLQLVILRILSETMNKRLKNFPKKELGDLVDLLRLKNAEHEDYELAGLLRDIHSNYEDLYEKMKPKTRKRTIIKNEEEKRSNL